MKAGVLPDEPEPLMPSFRGKLSNAQMRAVAAYVSAVAKEGPAAPETEAGGGDRTSTPRADRRAAD